MDRKVHSRLGLRGFPELHYHSTLHSYLELAAQSLPALCHVRDHANDRVVITVRLRTAIAVQHDTGSDV